MIAAPPGVRVYLACGTTDMRRGMAGLAMQVQQVLSQNPFDGAVFAFRGRSGGLIKLLWHDGIGMCLLTKWMNSLKGKQPTGVKWPGKRSATEK